MIIVTDVREEVLTTGRTDVLGEFAVTDLVPGPVTLAVNSPKHRPLALPVEIGGTGTTRVEVELRPGAQVRGTVRGGGSPLSDARVTLVDAAGNVAGTTRTGPDGAYWTAARTPSSPRDVRPGRRRSPEAERTTTTSNSPTPARRRRICGASRGGQSVNGCPPTSRSGAGAWALRVSTWRRKA